MSIYAAEVEADLAAAKSNKQAVLDKYAKRMKEIINLHGGQVSDIPVTDEEYSNIQNKMRLLNSMKVK